MRRVWDIFRPPRPEFASDSGVHDDWQASILGLELCGNPAIAHERQQLINGLLAGEPAATLLVGLLLVFRAAPADTMPTLLKDLGEAYYRWQPRSTNRPGELEEFLAAWLSRTCHKVGTSNTIELVHPGERFDLARHHASMPGVEITQVLGWIVLRKNGKVYSKARVAVK